MGETNKIPTPEQVRLIFKDSYNLYTKHLIDRDYKAFLKESHELKVRYPYEITESILLSLMNIFDAYSKEE